MSEREMLEYAAKACGYTPDGSFGRGLLVVVNVGQRDQRAFGFDPLHDDGDGARMEATLGISVDWTSTYVMADSEKLPDCMIEPFNPHNGDKQAARRLASLRVAAEIGRAM